MEIVGAAYSWKGHVVAVRAMGMEKRGKVFSFEKRGKKHELGAALC
jgi:hypothetical protein